MKRVWKVILIAALVLMVLGAVCAAVGWLTGASNERMIEVLFGGREMFDLIIKTLWDELAGIF